MVLAVTGCGPNPRFDFLKARPENALAYPGSTLVDTHSYPGGGIVDEGSSIDREFTSSASIDDIIAWYQTELANRNWTGGVASSGSGTDSYAISAAWFYPGVLLDLEFRAPANGTMRYVMRVSDAGCDVAAQIESLRETPEETLAPPGAQGAGDSWWSRKQADASRWRIRVYRSYALDSTSSDIERFYDSELAARGWTSVPPPASDPAGAPPDRTWQKGTVTALLFVGTGTYGTDEYEAALDQTLDKAGSPVAP
jgi:hypothetical protein